MKYAIVFSAENKTLNISSPYEKMAIGLAYSIRHICPDVDIYCGNFTNNKLTNNAILWFKTLNVTYVNDTKFHNIDNDDSYIFLRTYTKDYFAKHLLDQYDYLIYLDIDVVMLNKPIFDFNPTAPIALIDPMPQWVRTYHARHLADLRGDLCFNWVDVINPYNAYLFDLDWTNEAILTEHAADIAVSNAIHDSCLCIIDQQIGGYHCWKPVKTKHIFYHYDCLGPSGSLYNIQSTHPNLYKKYMIFFENILNIPVNNQIGYWEQIAEDLR